MTCRDQEDQLRRRVLLHGRDPGLAASSGDEVDALAGLGGVELLADAGKLAGVAGRAWSLVVSLPRSMIPME